jgi:deoxycytidylate deaminase
MDFVHISAKQIWLRSNQARVEEMLRHFNEFRVVPGSGIAGESCCAVTLDGDVIYGNSQAYRTDSDAAGIVGKAHAEVTAYELAVASGNEPRLLFCELSPCPNCRREFETQIGTIVYLYRYEDQKDAWINFHNSPIDQQIAEIRRQAGLS